MRNKHHIIQKKDGGSNYSWNLIRLDVWLHNAIHKVFPDPYTRPIDRINRILEIDHTVYNPEALNILRETLWIIWNMWIDAYDEKCIRDCDKFLRGIDR